MKKTMILVMLVAAIQLVAQEKSTITVKKAELNNGVLIVSATKVATANQQTRSFELHCNNGMSACKSLEPGSYLMVRLPKNWGMYDCQNVDLYPTSADPDRDQKIGEYCLIEK